MDRITLESWSEFDQEATLDDSEVISNVLLCGNSSRNGYDIPPSAFGSEDRVKTLYEGKLVFLDHASDPRKPLARSVKDIAGVVRNTRLKNGRPYGDIDTSGTASGPLLLSLARKRLRDVGMSHSAAYVKSPGGKTVQEVCEVFSVDAVVRPATTKTFHEREENSLVELEVLQKELDKVRMERDQAKESLTTLAVTLESTKSSLADLQAKHKEVTLACEGLQTKVDAFEAEKALAQRHQDVVSALEAAGIDLKDKELCSERFVQSLVKEADPVIRSEMIDDRKALLGRVAKGPSSTERRAPAGDKGFDPKAHMESLGSQMFIR